jgi:Carboxypeptidase regulatory-like domain
MAKKSVAAPPAATPAAPKSTKRAIPTLPCALVYFWQFALDAWGNCKKHLSRFSEESPRFTEKFVDGEIALINETKALPNNRTRVALTSEVLLALRGAAQSVSDMAARLEKAINYSYNIPAVAAVQRISAGLDTYADITAADWAGVSAFIETANEYLAANLAPLEKSGVVHKDFAERFGSVGTAFDSIWNQVKDKRQTAKDGTEAVAKGIARIKAELQPMLDEAAEYFKYEPELRLLFQQDYLLAQVRNGHPATITGRTSWLAVEGAKTGKPIAGILVEVLGVTGAGEEGKSTTTDKQGRYKLILAGGEFTLRFSGEGVVPFEKQVVLEPGINRRVNVQLEPAPVEHIAGVAAPSSTLGSMLNESLREVAQPALEPPTSATTASSTNGVTV